MFRSGFLLIVLSLVLAGAAYGQTSSIHGVVEDTAKAPIAGAVVVVRNKRTGLERVVETDAAGKFAVAGLSTDEYDVTARANGFTTKTVASTAATNDVVLSLDVETVRAEVSIFSGSRQAEMQESLNTSVEVVTRKEIENTGYQTVGEVLKEVPGIQTRLGSDTGTNSGLAGEQIQGVSSRQALVMLDGFPVIGARGIKSGVINLDRQSTDKVEQIEVVKGAASALYGSDAIGGVVNMITRDPSKPLEATFTVSGGSIGTLSENSTFGVRRSRYSGFFAFGRDKQNEFDLTPNTFDTTGAGWHRYDFFAKQKYEFSPKFYLTGLATVYTGDARGRSIGEPDPTQNFASGKQFDHTRDKTQSYGLSGNWAPTPKTVVQTRGYFSRYDEYTSTSFSNGTSFPDDNLFERFGRLDASVLHIFGERQIAQFGAEWTTDHYRGLNRLATNDDQSADTRTLWGQDKIALTNWATVTLGLRYDSHSIFGSAVSPKVGLNIRASDRLNLHASWGRGFRAPDLGQLYYKFYNPTNFYQVFGNPRLAPEHSGSWQVGAEYSSTKKAYRFGINFFRNDVVNLIESQTIGFVLPFPSPGALTIPQAIAYIQSIGLDPAQYPIRPFRLLIVYNNLSRVFTQGVESTADIRLPHEFTFSGGCTYLDARDKTTDAYLPERFRNQGFLKLGYDDEKLGLRANIRTSLYSGWKASSTSNRALQGELVEPKFQLVDVFVGKRIRKGVDLYGSVENLFDDRDQNIGKVDSTGQPLPIVRPDAGRMFRLGIKFDLSRDK